MGRNWCRVRRICQSFDRRSEFGIVVAQQNHQLGNGRKRDRRGAWGGRQEPDGRDPIYNCGERRWGLDLFVSGRVPSDGLEWGSDFIGLVGLQETISRIGQTVLSPSCLCFSGMIKSNSCNDLCTKSQTKPCQDKPRKLISVTSPWNYFWRAIGVSVALGYLAHHLNCLI